MKRTPRAITLLSAEDDLDDQVLLRDAFVHSQLASELLFVSDGEELLEYLRQRGRYLPPMRAPRPALILLDLNMPKKDGREVLYELKRDINLRQIPVVVLSSSRADEDISRSYDLGASSFITKPVSFDGLVEVVRTLGHYWFDMVALPTRASGT